MTGAFVNTEKAQCSIHESGLMCYKALSLSSKYHLDYFEGQNIRYSSKAYDFMIFNYHNVTSKWITLESLESLRPVRKFVIVLEMNEGNPFVLTPRGWFNDYLVLDPTMPEGAGVWAMPRPLEEVEVEDYKETDIPVIGSFGFATAGKIWGHIVEMCNNEFDKAIIRLNIPMSTYADPTGTVGIATLEGCKSIAKPGIEFEFTQNYMDKSELVKWCSKNTLNCFPYHRSMAGLAATTDQAISAKRPLLVSTDASAFRHIHRYLKPYPEWGLQDAITKALSGVLQMYEDWGPLKFSEKFEKILES